MNQSNQALDFLIREDQRKNPSTSILSSVGTLVYDGYDFYDVMRVMIEKDLGKCPPDVLKDLCNLVPNGRKLKTLGAHDIHGMIARWTASKFHTAPIQEVVRDIQFKCSNRQTGLYLYNSNRNPNNKRAANDPYILLVTEQKIRFLDLNRKISYHYTFESEDTTCDQNGDL